MIHKSCNTCKHSPVENVYLADRENVKCRLCVNFYWDNIDNNHEEKEICHDKEIDSIILNITKIILDQMKSSCNNIEIYKKHFPERVQTEFFILKKSVESLTKLLNEKKNEL